MDFITASKEQAQLNNRKLVLPEGCEPRIQHAAVAIIQQKLASEVVLLGDVAQIQSVAKAEKIDLSACTLIDPQSSELQDTFAQTYFELRKHKGLTLSEAQQKVLDPIAFGALLLRLGHVDALVAGAITATSAVLLAGFQIIKTKPDVALASSCFIMEVPNKEMGANGLFVFADCATIVNPNAEELANIAGESAKACASYLGVEPKVALLSYSTLGSGKGDLVTKVVEATQIAKEKYPDINFEGELQLDAAISPVVAQIKTKNSAVAGQANTLIFPDLQSGNIGYKLVQQFAGAGAYGPLMLGFNQPFADLSRGATIEDIVNTCAIILAGK